MDTVKITKQELLDMKLHEQISLDERLIILRVFDGWIYHHLNNSVFVPEVLNVEAHTTDVTDRTHRY